MGEDTEKTDAAQPDTSGAAYNWMREALFADISEAALTALASAAEQQQIRGGENLVVQGDSADSLFFVQTGRFRVLIEHDDGKPLMVAQIHAGEPVGELAFFGGGTRTATLQAARDSIVMALSRTAYNKVAAEYPEIPAALLAAVSKRLAHVTAKAPKMEAAPPRVIAVLPAGNSRYPVDFVEQLGAALRTTLDGKRDVLCVRDHDVHYENSAAYERWLHAQEADGGYILIDARGDDGWARLVCRNADALVMVADSAEGDTAPSDLENAAFDWVWPQNRTLVILRPSAACVISGSRSWITSRDPHLHVHAAMAGDGVEQADMARLSRYLSGNAVGLVLAGGGALGCAHLGIVQGLREAGIPIDYIGGTSAGAAMGAAIAQGDSVAKTLAQMEAMFITAKAMRRLTVPVHSLLDPAVFDEELKTRYSTKDIADQPIPFFAISTNLSDNDLFVHRSGPLWEAVRASGSLPTILPPFIDSDGNILVDGGVLDNIPVLTMREMKKGPNIVVTLGDASQKWRVTAAYDSLRRRGKLLRDVLLRRKAPEDFPGIVDVMQRSMVVSSRIASRTMLRDGDIMLTPPIIDGMKILDWHLGRRQSEIAATYVAEQMAENQDLRNLITK